ncbi:MAG: hypothetical protein DI571_08795 [Arsenicicoccus sp.]|nr:MAG: hypothetical protein DI571_08795 [Arsenicicoccus sp.]
MTHTHQGEDAEAQFRQLYAETGPEVLRFVRRALLAPGHCWSETEGGGAAGISVATDVDHRPAADSLSLMDFDGMAHDPGVSGLAPAVVMAGGWVGDDVTAVTLHEQGQVPVRATVADGCRTAWWPSEIPADKMPPT